MELFSAEAGAIKARITDWLGRPNFELESTFGPNGEVDAVTFLAVAQRLRAKGYAALPQGDYMTIITPEHIRYTINSLGVIQAYCEDDVLAGKPYDAMIKDRATADSQVDLDDYNTRIKLRRETSMAPDDAQIKKMFETWLQQRKAFRMIRRWSFETDGLRIDMSIVRSTSKTRSGDYKWQRKFREQDIMKNPPSYEIEVELLHKPDDTVEAAMKRLVKGTGEILRGIQKSTVLIRKSVADKVRAAYKELVGTDAFRGPSLITLQKENFSAETVKEKPNIRNGYNVTDKADGLRCLGFIDGKGDFFLIDMGMNVYRTGLSRPELRLSLVDGEWVTKTKDDPPKPMQQFLIFDVFFMTDKRPVSQFPFQAGATPPVAAGEPPREALPAEDSRHFQLKAWASAWNAGDGPKSIAGLTAQTKLQVSAKEYHFAKAGDLSIFRAATRVLTAARPYYTDGLIFTPNATPLPAKAGTTFWEQFKWKPPADNTIDFLVKTEKITGSKTEDKINVGIKPGGTAETISYKTLRLFVGSRNENPRDIVLGKQDLPARDRTYQGRRGGSDYKPVPFTPKEFPDPLASYCCLPVQRDPDTGEEFVMTEHTGEPIQDTTIVEMAYDPSQPPKWRWKPLRVRMDKTERLQRGILSRTLNSDANAEGVWNSIYDPVTETMIKTGSEEPTAAELAALGGKQREGAARQYFDREGQIDTEALTAGMKKFHSRYIKEKILYNVGLGGGDKTLLELACGVAGDLHKWMRMNVSFVFGVDYASKNIMDTADSAYKRYMEQMVERGGYERVAPMIFAIGDCSKIIVNGDAGANEHEKDLMRSVFGRTLPVEPVPTFVAEVGASRLKMGADCVSCMFAIHYMFETAEKFGGFLRNLSDTMKVGGYFIGCCPDGQKIFEMLRETEPGQSKKGEQDGVALWEIRKQYDVDDIPAGDDGFGLGIDVEFITIGKGHREYLVPFALLEDKLRTIGCELLTKEELKEVGMVNSTATFDVSWEMARKKGDVFAMGDTIKEFSFMNRWFIFKRKRQESMAAAIVSESARKVNTVAANTSAAAAAAAAPTVGRAANAKANAAARSAAATALQGQAPATLQAMAEAAPGAGVPFTPARTVPVEAGPAEDPARGRPFTEGEVFLFYGKASARKDTLGIKDAGAARWLAPSARFSLHDPETPEVIYPTMEHYIGGMLAKLATNKKELAVTLFSREGTIHQKFLNDRLALTDQGTRPLSEEDDFKLLEAEVAAVKDAMRAPYLKKFGAVINVTDWATVKDRVLQEAVEQRWKSDARFRKIIEAARERGKYLLYYTPGSTSSNVGGVRSSQTGRIEGENRIGKIMMRLAGYPD